MTNCPEPHQADRLWCAATEPSTTVRDVDERQVCVAIYSRRAPACGIDAAADRTVQAVDNEIIQKRPEDEKQALDPALARFYVRLAFTINGQATPDLPAASYAESAPERSIG